MRIVIDLRIFGTKPGGIGKYNQEFLKELIKIDQDNEYILLFEEDPQLDLPKNFQIKICRCHWYGLKEQIFLPWVIYKLKPDLVHFTHFNVPLLYHGNYVLTIHDLIMTKFPSRRASTLNPIFFKIKYFFYKLVIKNAVHRAKKIIAVSKFTAEDIKNYFKLSDLESKKITVVYEGVSEPQLSTTTVFGLPQKYFLYVGNAYPHKNLDFLLETFGEFLKKYPEYYLVLVGNKNYFYQRLERSNHVRQVIFAGYVADDKLSAYYQKAAAYIFPSLYEGFGLPPLEAMSYGVPVLASNSSCLSEILGQSVLYFDSQNKEDLIKKMSEIISQVDLRDKLINFGYKQFKKYSWSKMAQDIWEIYKILV